MSSWKKGWGQCDFMSEIMAVQLSLEYTDFLGFGYTSSSGVAISYCTSDLVLEQPQNCFYNGFTISLSTNRI